MRQLLLCLTAFLTLTGFSQDSTKTAPSKWTVGLSGSHYAFDNIKAHAGFDHKYTYSPTGIGIGFDLSYHFSKRSAITTGLQYFTFAYKVDYVWIFSQPGDAHIPRTSDIGVGYVDIPAIYNFSIVSRDKIVVYTVTGIAGSILSSETGSTTYEDNSVRNSEFLYPFILSLELGAGLQYNVTDKLGIKIELQYRQFLKGFDSIMDQSPTASSQTVGIIYKINFRNFFKKGAWRPLPQ